MIIMQSYINYFIPYVIMETSLVWSNNFDNNAMTTFKKYFQMSFCSAESRWRNQRHKFFLTWRYLSQCYTLTPWNFQQVLNVFIYYSWNFVRQIWSRLLMNSAHDWIRKTILLLWKMKDYCHLIMSSFHQSIGVAINPVSSNNNNNGT